MACKLQELARNISEHGDSEQLIAITEVDTLNDRPHPAALMIHRMSCEVTAHLPKTDNPVGRTSVPFDYSRLDEALREDQVGLVSVTLRFNWISPTETRHAHIRHILFHDGLIHRIT